MRRERRKYQIAWVWRDSDEFPTRFDDLEATTAEAAIRKLRKMLREEYVVNRGDVVILEVYRI